MKQKIFGTGVTSEDSNMAHGNRGLKKLDDAGVSFAVGFDAAIVIGGLFLGVYNLIELDSIVPFSEIPLLKLAAQQLGLWWFAVAAGGLILYVVAKRAEKLPSSFDRR